MSESIQEFLPWNEDFSLHNIQIDNEHRQILKSANELHAFYISGASFLMISSKFSELFQFTSQHFKNEEKILIALLSPEKFRAHKSIHKNLLQQMAEFYYVTEAEKRIPPGFFKFFKMWFISEALGADKGCLLEIPINLAKCK